MALKLSDNAKYILEQRYLLRDKDREIIETPSQLFRRVARAISSVEFKYGKSTSEVKKLENEFYNMMVAFDFLPNSPTLMNAGTSLGQLSACFVIPVEDDIDSIFEAVKNVAKIHKTGGGTGISFSRLRPMDDVVKTTGGIASGPLSFMTVFDAATETIKQGGKRRGANMGVLRVDHPDIGNFIVCKYTEGVLKNFNLSVGITSDFMKAAEKGKYFKSINPRTNKPVKTTDARSIWIMILTASWNNGEPGLIFLDTINKDNPTPELGEIESTNPCGEQPLLPYESCNLGSINLSRFVIGNKKEIDWDRLREVIRLSVRFLDNVIDANKFPLEQIREATLPNRKIGLGVMGWADLLLDLGIRYDSSEAIKLAEKIIKFVKDEGFKMSKELGEEKGSFANKDRSIYKDTQHLRNATITTVAPTGTISIIADCSQGIEPILFLAAERNVEESLGKSLIEINPHVKRSLELKGLWSAELEQSLIESQCITCTTLPQKLKEAFVTSEQIDPEWHVRMQAAFQKHTDNAVSKTINLPNGSTIHDIEKVYKLAHKLGCKGITVYRNGSREKQLLTKAVIDPQAVRVSVAISPEEYQERISCKKCGE